MRSAWSFLAHRAGKQRMVFVSGLAGNESAVQSGSAYLTEVTPPLSLMIPVIR